MSTTVNDEQLAKFLSTTPYFNNIEADDIAVLARLFEVLRFEDAATIFDEGEVGDGWYLVVEGEVMILRDGHGDKPAHVLAHLEPGEGFGEMALLEDAPRMAEAQASGATRVARLPRSAFTRLLENNHPAAAILLREMAVALCRRLREVTGILQDMVDNPAPSRPLSADALDNLIRAMMAQN